MASAVLLESVSNGVLQKQRDDGAIIPVKTSVYVYVRNPDPVHIADVQVPCFSDQAMTVPLTQPLTVGAFAAGAIPGYAASGTSVDFVDVGSGARTQGELLGAGGLVVDSSASATSPILAAGGARVNRSLSDLRTINAYGTYTSGDMTSLLYTATEDCRNTGRTLKLPPYGAYLVSGSVTNSANPNPLTLYADDPDTAYLMQAPGIGAAMIISTGSLATAVAITSASAIGANQVVITSTAGLNPGDIVLLRDSTQPIYGYNGSRQIVSLSGEYAEIKSVDSGTQLTFYGCLDFGYSTSADLRKLSGISHSISGLGFRNSAPGTQSTLARAIGLNYFYRVKIINCDFRDLDGDAILLQWGTDASIVNPTWLNLHDLETSNTPYGTILSKAVQHVTMVNPRSRYGRHMITTGGVAATEVGQSYIKTTGGMAVNHSQAAYDCHPGAWRVVFDNPTVHNSYPAAPGVQVRGPDCMVLNAQISQASTGVNVAYGADRARIVGGRISGGNKGINIQDSDDCFIGGDLLIANPVTSGIETNLDAGWTLAQLTLGDLTIKGNPATAAINNAAAAVINYL